MKGSDHLAQGLGWFGIGLGLWKLFEAKRTTRALGLEGCESLVRLCGARDVATGIGSLTVNPKPVLWARVAGDALDLAALATALRDKHNPQRDNLQLAVAMVGATTAVDLYVAQAQTRRHGYQSGVTPDYSHRSGFPKGLEAARGAARDFETPGHMKASLPSPASSPGPRTQTGKPNSPISG
ncbi:hypothetical protein [Litchfieldella xinjiangensis]|uniref:hypothetical protein n=1 Tax=Litchfieldella xinjiangensis TaxID=1166948 RepID=UPI000B0CD65F|nr:hypothetical protein [Halomonas xinjiangensis]